CFSSVFLFCVHRFACNEKRYSVTHRYPVTDPDFYLGTVAVAALNIANRMTYRTGGNNIGPNSELQVSRIPHGTTSWKRACDVQRAMRCC
ncbi:hypothetical protein FQN60_002829, partial [Etheostoma spectabile]